MSRRRKHGDSPGLKNPPRTAAAAEECSSVVEPRKRRLRAARGSGLGGVGEGPPRARPQQEQPPAAAACSKSHPEGEAGLRGLCGPRRCSPTAPRAGWAGVGGGV